MHRTPTGAVHGVHEPTASITEHPCLPGLPRRGNFVILAVPSRAREIRQSTCLNAAVSIVEGKTFDLDDGRVLRMMESGVADGTPILVFHPTPSSRLFVRQHADAALRTGVRLVGFNRPGSGGATMTAPGLRVVAEDAIRVADAAGLDTFPVLGFSGGTPFAAATAALFPDRVRAVGLCAAVAPLPLDETDALDQEKRHLADLLALDDGALAAALVVEASDEDARYLDAVVAASQVVTLRDAVGDEDGGGGTPTYETLDFDHAAFSPPWDVDVTTVTAPTWVWQGTRDQVTPLVHAEWYAARLPTATLVPRPGLGHLGSFEAHRDEMLATLRDAG
jgi:pimeloyl-ACP methyl ester carboxylesterase